MDLFWLNLLPLIETDFKNAIRKFCNYFQGKPSNLLKPEFSKQLPLKTERCDPESIDLPTWVLKVRK